MISEVDKNPRNRGFFFDNTLTPPYHFKCYRITCRAPFTLPDLASLVDLPFAAHKEGKKVALKAASFQPRTALALAVAWGGVIKWIFTES